MGPKVVPAPTTQIEGASTVPAIASPALAEELGALRDMVEADPHGIPPAVVEEQKRQADLARLNMMAVETRREIASMDMMGEFGSKVGIAFSNTMWRLLTNRSTSLSNTCFGIESRTNLLVMSFSPIGPIVSSVRPHHSTIAKFQSSSKH